MSAPEHSLACPTCQASSDVCSLLDSAVKSGPSSNSLRFSCPLCAASIDVRVFVERIEIGYIYAAGSAHFAAVHEVAISGLSIDRDDDSLCVSIGNRSWLFTGSTLTPPRRVG